MENLNKNSMMSFGLIIGIALIMASIVVSVTFYKIRALDNTLSVTGSAKTEVVSDTVKWSSQITRPVRISELQNGYSQIASDLTKVKKFMIDSGIPEEAITVSTVSFYENYGYQQNQRYVDKEFILSQNITVNSSDIDKITNISKDINAVVSQGVIFQTNSLEYYISSLPELRVSLLGEAVKDAESRANSLAEASGKRVGKLKSASSGVVQVLSTNSTDISDYGSYDTSQINKQVMVTVKASFTLK
jgi:hypothetical protein